MNKKEMAISFLRLASSGKVREAYNTYILHSSAITIPIFRVIEHHF